MFNYVTVLTCTCILLLPSDGPAAQNKHFKNFANISYHSDDFGLGYEWNFFVTSHCKNTCNGFGGTVKPLAARQTFKVHWKDISCSETVV